VAHEISGISLKRPNGFSFFFSSLTLFIMAKFRSLFRVSGDIGDVNFYEKDGQKFMRQTTSLDKARIESDDAFKRTRENMREFGGAATAGKALRVGLANVLKRYADHRFTGRLTSIFKQIQRAATTGARGQRSVEILPNKAKLVNRNLHISDLLEMVFNAPYTLTPSVSRDSVTLDVPIFNVDNLVTPPRAASHFKLVLVICCLSDHVFDAAEGVYAPVDPDLNRLNAVAESAYLPVGGTLAAAVQLVATLPGAPAMTSTTGLVACVGIEFYQQVTGSMYFLAESNGMMIANVF
jgi:hypothetical protein